MNRSMQMIVCLTAALGAGSAFAQTHDDSTPTFTTEPHVYVSTTNGINLYYAAANGVPSQFSRPGSRVSVCSRVHWRGSKRPSRRPSRHDSVPSLTD
jgi:hypothetical protein